QSGFANMFQPSLGQAMGEGLRPKEGGFSADINIGGWLSPS
ncbi:hypothetical protein LCGC14_2185730, partial [marine sediment metagenome]